VTAMEGWEASQCSNVRFHLLDPDLVAAPARFHEQRMTAGRAAAFGAV
jgi:hypothetical protein